jgi:hypothetical protein
VKKRSARPASKPARPAAPAQPAPEVVYTPGKPFNGRRVLLHLTTIVAVVLAISFGISVFFKVEVITVSGTDKYDVWTVKEASGIEEGENLLSFGKAKAAGKIKTALPYVESVRIGIKLPDTVNIEIKELDVVYAIKDAVEQWWLMTSDGKVVDKADLATAGDYTQILGVKLATPVAGAQAVAQEEAPAAPEETTDGVDMPTMMPIVTAADKLDTALKILNAAGFTNIKYEEYLESEEPKDEVLSQSVEAEQQVPVSTEIVLKLSYGYVTKTVRRVFKLMEDVTWENPYSVVIKDAETGEVIITETLPVDATEIEVELTGHGVKNYEIWIDDLYFDKVEVDFSEG